MAGPCAASVDAARRMMTPAEWDEVVERGILDDIITADTVRAELAWGPRRTGNLIAHECRRRIK